MKVVIAGSGLVGAATALALSQQGHECVMYDQVDFAGAIQKANGGVLEAINFGESGGAVMLNSNALRVLKSLGVLDAVLSNSLRSPFVRWYKIDGSSRIEFDAKAVYTQCGETDSTLQCPVQIMRSKLHDILVRAAFKAGARTFVGKKLVSVVEMESNVTATFADGTSATGDLLIGADGIHSATRRQLFGQDLMAKFTGSVGYIGVVNLAEHNIKLDEFCSFFIDREKKRIVCVYKASEQAAAIQVGHFGDPDPEASKDSAYRPYTNLAKHSQRLADMIEEWGVPANLVMMVRKSHRISPLSIYDLPDLEMYHKGRVALIGDAAHGMVPNAGLGLGTGLEDVGTLLELFKQLPDASLAKVLALYSEIRVPRATQASKRSRFTATQYYNVSALGVGFSHFVQRVGVYAFNRNWIPFVKITDCLVEVADAIAKDVNVEV
ncbi:hypothetical protein HDU98_000023 [Podochytrium sp. JEL0797]|nr:hypothetical protein HDU98_000023 [Podochytrium sp. JEL0797]